MISFAVVRSWLWAGNISAEGLCQGWWLRRLGAYVRWVPANAASQRTMFPRFTLSKLIFVMFFIISFLTSFSLKKSRGPHPSNPRPQGQSHGALTTWPKWLLFDFGGFSIVNMKKSWSFSIEDMNISWSFSIENMKKLWSFSIENMKKSWNFSIEDMKKSWSFAIEHIK